MEMEMEMGMGMGMEVDMEMEPFQLSADGDILNDIMEWWNIYCSEIGIKDGRIWIMTTIIT